MAEPVKTPLWRRMLISAGRTALTLGFAATAIGIGVAAHGVLSARTAAVESPPPAPVATVAPVAVEMQGAIAIDRRFTGQFEAPQETALGFEEGGTLAEVLVREGDAVAEGAVIARLDTRLLAAERTRLVASRAALQAQAELARRTNDRQQALLAEGHVTAQRVDETSLQLVRLEASMAEIDAAIASLDVRLSKTEIRAPFAGRIGARNLDTGAVAGPGVPVVTLLETGPARFRVGLDPELAAGLSPGVAVEIDTGTALYAARLDHLAPELEAATRSRIAFFELTDDIAPPSRATGEVILSENLEAEGAWMPLSALRQGPRGTWVVLTVSDGDAPTIGLEAAEILHLDQGRAFVRGSFEDGTQILPDGTHRVVPGETVRLAEGGL